MPMIPKQASQTIIVACAMRAKDLTLRGGRAERSKGRPFMGICVLWGGAFIGLGCSPVEVDDNTKRGSG